MINEIFKLLSLVYVISCVLFASCTNIREGTWCFTQSNGITTKGSWQYSGDNVLWFPGFESHNHKDGRMVAWWYADQKFCEYKCVSGKPDGVWLLWYPTGTLKCKGNYKEGNRIGKWVWYAKNGTIESEQTFNNDGSLSEIVDYWPNGHIQAKATYDKGRLIKSECWGEDGRKSLEDKKEKDLPVNQKGFEF